MKQEQSNEESTGDAPDWNPPNLKEYAELIPDWDCTAIEEEQMKTARYYGW